MFSQLSTSDMSVAAQTSDNVAGRSRARRKEYIEELESRLRSWDRLGIEASTELQTAARKVLDENRKLRWLLTMRGVSEAEIAVVLGGSTDKPSDEISSAPALNTMLERRMTSDSIPSKKSLSPHIRASSLPRNVHAVVPISTTGTLPANLSSCESLSPTSIISSMETPPPVSYRTPTYLAPTNGQVPEIKREDNSFDYSYEAYTTPWTYSHNYGYIPDATAYQNTSCVNAASIITTMRSDENLKPAVDFACPTPIRDYYSNAAFGLERHSKNHTGI